MLLTFPSLPGENVLHVRDADTHNKIYHALELQFGKRYPWYEQSAVCLYHWVFVLQLFSQTCFSIIVSGLVLFFFVQNSVSTL